MGLVPMERRIFEDSVRGHALSFACLSQFAFSPLKQRREFSARGDRDMMKLSVMLALAALGSAAAFRAPSTSEVKTARPSTALHAYVPDGMSADLVGLHLW